MSQARFGARELPQNRVRVNYMIRISPVRLVGVDNEQLGLVETPEAMRMAQEAGLDLVEIVPDARPPVCRIMDYGKYKYDLSKQAKNKGSKAAEMKEIRLGRSVKIDPHDIQVRIDQARRFLLAGHKVMVTQKFKGREIAHAQLGIENLREVADQLQDVAKVEQPPRWAGKQASIIIAPDRAKVEAIKRKLEKERAEKLARGEKVEEEKSIEELDAQLAAEVAKDDAEDHDASPDPEPKPQRKPEAKADTKNTKA